MKSIKSHVFSGASLLVFLLSGLWGSSEVTVTAVNPALQTQTVCANAAITPVIYTIVGLSNSPNNDVTFNYSPSANGIIHNLINANPGVPDTIIVSGNPTANVILTITFENGNNDIVRTVNITVVSPVILGATQVCIGSTIQLTATPAGGTWSSSSSAATVSSSGLVTGFSAGSPTITYTTATSGCVDTQPITVNANPVLPAITDNPDVNGVICDDETVQLSGGGSGGTGVWSSLNTNVATVSNGPNPAAGLVTGSLPASPSVFTTSIQYIYTVTATGCKDTSLYAITVNPNASLVLTSAASTANQTVCAGVPIVNIVYTGTNTDGITGPFPLSGLNGSYNSNNQTYTISGTPSANINSFTITASGIGGCSPDSEIGSVTIQTAPVGTPASFDYCSMSGEACYSLNDNLTYTWSAPSSSSVTGEAGNSAPGVTELCVDLIGSPSNDIPLQYSLTPSSGGCTGAQFTVTVTVHPHPVVDPVVMSAICSGDQLDIDLSASTPSNYSWSITSNNDNAISGVGAGSVPPIDDIPVNSSHTVPNDFCYLITPVSQAYGCTGVDYSLCIDVNPSPVLIDPTQTVPICAGFVNPIPLGASVPSTFEWIHTCPSGLTGSGCVNEDNGATQIPTNFSHQNNNPLIASYDLTITANGTGCQNTTSQNVNISVKPTPIISNYDISTSPCSGVAFNATPSSNAPNFIPQGTSYTWSSPPSGSVTCIPATQVNPGVQSINVTLSQTTNTDQTATFSSVTAEKNGCFDTFNITVDVHPEPIMDAIVTKEICSGEELDFTPTISDGTFPDGTVYNWNAPNPNNVCASNVEDSQGFELSINNNGLPMNNESALEPCIMDYTVFPQTSEQMGSCSGDAFVFRLTVNPIADFNIVPFVADTICSGPSLNIDPTSWSNLNAIPDGTEYTWLTPVWTNCPSCTSSLPPTSPTPVITSQLTNNSADSRVVTFSVTPVSDVQFGNCPADPIEFDVLVTPGPQWVSPLQEDILVCDEGQVPTMVFDAESGDPVQYSWTCSDPTIGLAAVGTTSIISSFPGQNVTDIGQITATVSVIARSIINLDCATPPQVFTITVNPTPALSVGNIQVCEGDQVELTLNGTPVAIPSVLTYDYTNTTADANAIGLATSLSSGNQVTSFPGFTAVNNTAQNEISSTFEITPYVQYGSETPCPGTPVENVIITVLNDLESPVINASFGSSVCAESYGQSLSIVNPLPGVTYSWSSTLSSTPITIFDPNSSNTIVSFAQPGSVTIQATSLNGICPSEPTEIMVTITDAPADPICAPVVTTPDGNGLAVLNNTGDSYQWGFLNTAPGPDFLTIELDVSGDGNDQFYYGNLLQNDGGLMFVTICRDGCCSNSYNGIDCGDDIIRSEELDIVESAWDDQHFILFPNPADDVIYLKSIDMNDLVSISILDMTGKMVVSESVNMQSGAVSGLDVMDLTTGIYMLKVQNSDHREMVFKIVIR